MPSNSASLPRLSLRRINKTIGHHRILSDVTFDLLPSQIHVLVGANGAGKSTLIRILSGADTDFRGEIQLNGQPLVLHGPRAARRAGIHVIYQELSLVDCLSAVDNWVLAEERPAFSWLTRAEARRTVRRQCERLGIAVDVDHPLEKLTLGARQLLEIARALSERAEVLILDEPTSALSETEAAQLLAQLDRLRRRGTAILYVSHRMEEIYKIADHITVLRDGVCVVTCPAQQLSRSELVAAMVGPGVPDPAGRDDAQPQAIEPISRRPARLQIHGLCASGNPGLCNVSFGVASGEILGICGLGGSGAAELLPILGGAQARQSGTVEWEGKPLPLRTPREAFAEGIAFLPPDRHQSVFATMSLLWNGCMSALDRYSRGGVLQRERCRRDVSELAEKLSLGQYSLDLAASALSGGNQQKMALLRCLLSEPKVLLLSEPTRGVDIAAKQLLHEWIRAFAAQRLSVVLQSSELDELVALCHRVLVLCQGRVVATLAGDELNRQRLLSAMMGNSA